jgi:hypothetical protein
LGGDRFDFDQLISVAENSDTEQRARRVVIAEVTADDPPGSQEILLPLRRDVDRCLHDVFELGSSGTQGDPKVHHDLFRLACEISSCHGVTC